MRFSLNASLYVVLTSFLILCTSAVSHQARSIVTFKAVRKSTPLCQWQYTQPCLANRNSPPLTSFLVVLFEDWSPFPVAWAQRWGVTRQHKLHAYLMATASIQWALRLPYLLSILPTMPVAAHPCSQKINCLWEVHTERTVCWTQVRQDSS